MRSAICRRGLLCAAGITIIAAGLSAGSRVASAQDTAPVPAASAAPEAAPSAPLQNTESVSQPVTITAVGDVMIGSTFPDDSSLPPNDGKNLMVPFYTVLHASDITFGNLEGPILEGGVSTKCPPEAAPAPGAPPPKPNCFAFRMPTRFGSVLKDAGFNVMSVANNHAGDFGDVGRASTRKVLEEEGIQFAGSDRGQFATTVLDVRGTRVGFVGFAHNDVVPNVNELAAARQLVSDLKSRTDLVVVSFHGGGEGVDHQHVLPLGTTEIFYKEPRGDLRAFTHAVIDAGADLVLGHGPHVLRGMEIYKGHLIAYSMGNFCTYGMFSLHDETSLTAAFQIVLGLDGRFVSGRLVPGRQNKPGGPIPDISGEAIRVVRKLSTADFGENSPSIEDDGRFTARVAADTKGPV